MSPLRRLQQWLTDPTPPTRPPDAMVEIAWLPLWQAHLVAHELWERDQPNVVVEDHTSHLRLGAREPMARLFVLELRREVATALVRELIGDEPSTQRR